MTRGTMSASREAIWPPGNSARLPSSRSAIRVWQPTTAPGRGRSDVRLVTRLAVACAANRARRSSGPVTIRARAWLIAGGSKRALRPSAISARTASTAPSRPFGAPRALPDCAARAALTAFQRVGFALAAAVLPVGAVHLDDPHAGG